MEKPMIGIGIPTAGSMKVETVVSLINLFKEGLSLQILFVKSSMIHANRSSIILKALKAQCTHVFFLDSDMELPYGILSKLLEHEKNIVSINANKKGLPLISVVKPLKTDEDGKELFECESVGLACTLVDLKVFEFIPMPWFVSGYKEDNTTPEGEDEYFCKKARENGFTIWCDPSMTAGHIGDYTY